MSYQSPYQPPTGYSNFDYVQPDLLAPARRASVLMFVLGGLAVLGSFCCVGLGAMVPQLMQQPEFSQRMATIPGATPELMRGVFIVMGIASLFAAIAMITLAFFVRRGGKGSIVTAMVLSVIAILLMVVYIAAGTLQGAQEAVGGICMGCVPIVLLVILTVMLASALKASEKLAAHRYSVQYWQHAQQHAYAQQAGYGYVPPPPPQQQPTLLPPPPPPASGDSNGPPAQG